MLGVLVAAGLTACGGDDGGQDDAEATDNGGLCGHRSAGRTR